MASSNSTLHSPASYGPDPTTPPNTTFVQADPSNFRAVVQKLTGASDDPSAHKLPLTLPSRLSSQTTTVPRKQPPPPFKLHERRNNYAAAKKLEHLTIGRAGATPPSSWDRNNGSVMVMLNNSSGNSNVSVSPSSYVRSKMAAMMMGSPVSPLEEVRSPHEEEEERAIAEKGFYLRPVSPLSSSTPPPELLPLFPLRSPNAASHHHHNS